MQKVNFLCQGFQRKSITDRHTDIQMRLRTSRRRIHDDDDDDNAHLTITRFVCVGERKVRAKYLLGGGLV